MEYVGGSILTDDGFVEGSVGIEAGVVVELSKRKVADEVARGIVIPSFTDAHTHLGDAFIRIELGGTLEEIVAPPHGLKHRLLAKADPQEVVMGIRTAVEGMTHGGTGAFLDFRESGIAGARMLYEACLGMLIEPTCLGRPEDLRYDADEVGSLLRVCDGLGVSSMRDWPTPDLQRLALDARRAGRMFAIHCSEVVREDIDKVLDLKPTFLVHMAAAKEGDYERCADADVPIVVCPRSNAFFGFIPDIPLMLSAGVTLLLGTDNAMLGAPSMLREIDFAYRISRLNGQASPEEILKMAIRGRKGLSGGANNGVQIGDKARLTILDIPAGADPYSALLRATEDNVALVIHGERKWQRRGEQKEAPQPRRGPSRGKPKSSGRLIRRNTRQPRTS